MIFTDGSMLRTPPASFELVDLDRLAESCAAGTPRDDQPDFDPA